MLVNRFESSWKSATASSLEKIEMKERMSEDLVVSGRAQIIEVSTEASFQPLLQLYLLLPILLDQFKTNKPEEIWALFSINDVFDKPESAQFWSVLTSIISLSWSFTFYQAVQKRGALDFGSNSAGRVLLLLANLLQISSRLLALVLYVYLFGP